MSDEKRFFWCSDGDTDYSFVARDMDHAKNILRDTGLEFGIPSRPFDRADLEWGEFTAGRAASFRCDTSESRGIIPLTECELGEWFCSEY